MVSLYTGALPLLWYIPHQGAPARCRDASGQPPALWGNEKACELRKPGRVGPAPLFSIVNWGSHAERESRRLRVLPSMNSGSATRQLRLKLKQSAEVRAHTE